MTTHARVHDGGEAGFSLVEVLIALFITAVLAGLGTSLLLGTLAGKERFDAAASGARGLELAHATLARDLGQLARRAVRTPEGSLRPTIFEGGVAAPDGPLLAFARAGWDNPDGAEPRGSIVYVEYALEDDRLVRRSWARVDPTRRTPEVERVLLSGVTDAEVAFGDGARWTDGFAAPAWGAGESFAPALVSLDLEIADVGDVRQVFATGYVR